MFFDCFTGAGQKFVLKIDFSTFINMEVYLQGQYNINSVYCEVY